MSNKICSLCNEPIPEWAQNHGMDNCAHNLKDRVIKLEEALSEYADYENWVSATGPMGSELSGWCGKGKGWHIAQGVER